jgi:hypothetical protein
MCNPKSTRELRYTPMQKRFIALIALVETVSVALFLFLYKQAITPDKIGLTLVWLLPVTFGLHVGEEFVLPGGFSDWNKSYRPQLAGAMTPSYLFKVNAIPGVAAVLTPLGVFNYVGGYSFAGIRAWHVFLSVLAFNALYHIRGAIQTKQYSPGVVSSIVLYLPLAIVSFTYFLRAGVLDVFSALAGLAVGSAFQSVLDYFKGRSLEKGSVTN